jgi:hypothetical protein
MITNNKSTLSPTRQISKRLNLKMKLKNIKKQKSKILNQNHPQLKTNQLQDKSIV